MVSIEKLEIDCQEALVKILENLNAESSVQLEQSLWNKIIKVYKENSNSAIMNYLLGFYLTLHEAIFHRGSSNDKYLKFKRCSFDVKRTNVPLLYNVFIRIGDLYRYGDSRKNARHHYQQALQLDPRKGQSYNQLALCTPLTKPYQCIYFSVRAYHATIDPVKAALSNIKVAMARLDCPVFDRFRSTSKIPLKDGAIKVNYPETGQEWFHLTVISIHFNDLNGMFEMLLDQILKTIDCDFNGIKLDFLLMSLDVALDWILKDCSPNSNNNFPSIENLKKTFQMKLQDGGNYRKQNWPMVEEHYFALAHNWILKEFGPLKNLYENMPYYYETEQYQIDKHRRILISRLISKLQNF